MADIDEIGEERLREVGQYLAHLREMHGLTQKEAANLAGMTASAYLSLLESGKRMISLKTLEKLSAAYGKVTLDEMVDAIGFTPKGKLLTEKSKRIPSRTGELEVAEAEIVKPAAREEQPAEQLSMVDAALQFIGHDRDFQMPFPPRTTREKALVVASYQQSTKRQLLTDSELQTLSEQD